MSQFQLRQINVQFPPATGATYTICRQGATVSETSTITFSSTVQVPVFDLGRIQIGDNLLSSANPGVLLSVDDISPDRIWLSLRTSDSGNHSGRVSPGPILVSPDPLRRCRRGLNAPFECAHAGCTGSRHLLLHRPPL